MSERIFNRWNKSGKENYNKSLKQMVTIISNKVRTKLNQALLKIQLFRIPADKNEDEVRMARNFPVLQENVCIGFIESWLGFSECRYAIQEEARSFGNQKTTFTMQPS
jgi:hypothetical protein